MSRRTATSLSGTNSSASPYSEGASPEHFSDGRGVEQHRSLVRRESVEPRRDELADRRRQEVPVRDGSFDDRGGELFDEERVALRGLDHARRIRIGLAE